MCVVCCDSAAGVSVEDLQYELEQAQDDLKEMEAKLVLRNNRIKELESSMPLKGPKVGSRSWSRPKISVSCSHCCHLSCGVDRSQSAGSAVNAVRSKRSPRRSATERYDDDDFDDD